MIKRKINNIFFLIILLSAVLNTSYLIFQKSNAIVILFIVVTILQFLLFLYIIKIYVNNKLEEKPNVYIKKFLMYLVFFIILIFANTIKFYNYIWG